MGFIIDNIFHFVVAVFLVEKIKRQIRTLPGKFCTMRWKHRKARLSLEGIQDKFRAREILKVLSTESYRTDSRIRLGTGTYRRQIPFPFPASPHHSQEGTNQPHSQSTY